MCIELKCTTRSSTLYFLGGYNLEKINDDCFKWFFYCSDHNAMYEY